MNEKDNVLIFYSDKANSMTFDVHVSINKTIATVEYFKVSNGSKNSLDFQLVTYLGYLIADNTQEKYIIVSNDEGFASVINFWSERKIELLRCATINPSGKVIGSSDPLYGIIPQFSNDFPVINRILESSHTKQECNGALVKHFKGEKAGQIYRAIKPMLIANKVK